MKALNCPNCGGAYDPSKYQCNYCGSFIFLSDEKEFNVPLETIAHLHNTFESHKNNKTDYPGIYIFGSLLGKGEVPIRLGSANYFKSTFVNVGGKILLTESNLYFSSHKFVQSKMDVSIKLDQIQNCSYDKSYLGISDQISVYANEKRHKFVVYGGKEWIKLIEKAQKQYNSQLPCCSTGQKKV